MAFLITVLCVVFFNTPWAGAPRVDQVVYLHQVSQYHTLGEILSESPSWHRLHSAGDYTLYRPVLFLFLGLQYFFFDYHFALWQITGFLLHAVTVLLFYSICRKLGLPLIWQILTPLLFGCSFLGSELVIWSHLTGYVLFTLFLMASLRLLLEYFDARATIWWSLLFAALCTFTYEAGPVYCGIVGLVLLFVRRRTHALLYFAIPILYLVLNLLDYRAIFHQMPQALSDEHTGFPGLLVVASLTVKQLGFWAGGFLAPAFYEVMPAGRATFTGYGSTVSPLRLLNAVAILFLLAGGIAALFRVRWRDRLRPILAAGSTLAVVAIYSAIIAVGRSVPRGLTYTLNSNIYYAYIPVLGLLLAFVFLVQGCSKGPRILAIGAIALVLCNASKTAELVRGYRYEYSAPRLRLLARLAQWQHGRGSRSNAFYEIAANCGGQNEIWANFSVHLRRGAIWKGPFRVAELLFPERSYALNRDWLKGAEIERTVLNCPPPSNVRQAIASSSQEGYPPEDLSDSSLAPWGSAETDEDTWAGLELTAAKPVTSIAITLFSPGGQMHLRDIRVVAADNATDGVPAWKVVRARVGHLGGYSQKFTIPVEDDASIVKIEMDRGDSFWGKHRYWGIICMSHTRGDARNYLSAGRGIYVRELSAE